MRKLRIGAVSYLNTKPLVFGLEQASGGGDASLSFDLPSRLADQLAAGQLDVALIPSIEALQHPEYTVVSDACIACCGPVWSVKLLSRVDPRSITSLALDEGSRTSVVLVQILLDNHFSISPELSPLSMDADWKATECDAVLIIGDRAMNPDPASGFAFQVDLGQWWYQWTGLPFVFALWAARNDLPPEEYDHLDSILTSARDSGLANRERIADQFAGLYGLSGQQCMNYFQNCLNFRMGPAHKNGLERFRKCALELDLITQSRQLQFHDC